VRRLHPVTSETIEEFAGYVKIVSPFANIDGLYPPDMANRLATALADLGSTDLSKETRAWIKDTVMRLACCAEKAEAVRDELRERGYCVPARAAVSERVPAEWR
jgi:hypothetical protein